MSSTLRTNILLPVSRLHPIKGPRVQRAFASIEQGAFLVAVIRTGRRLSAIVLFLGPLCSARSQFSVDMPEV